jgi:hypothetical protein
MLTCTLIYRFYLVLILTVMLSLVSWCQLIGTTVLICLGRLIIIKFHEIALI